MSGPAIALQRESLPGANPTGSKETFQPYYTGPVVPKNQEFYDTASERVVLSKILNDGFHRLPENAPTSSRWFTQSNGLIFDALKTLSEQGGSLDVIRLTQYLHSVGKLDQAGGPAEVTELSSVDCFDGILQSACESLAKHFKKRTLYEQNNRAASLIASGDSEAALEVFANTVRDFTNFEAGTGKLGRALVGESELESLSIPVREPILGDWFKSADYGIIFGQRGLGKSWLGMGVARAIAEGRDFGPWKCPQARRVLYVDGEMSLDDYRDRVRTLSQGPGKFLTLSHQEVFNKSQTAICLSDRGQQTELTGLCEANNIDVLILDNGACLFRGVKENDADDFRDMVEGWLLDLRRRGIAVILIQHAGRNGNVRGTSKREDAAFWIIRLDDAGQPDGNLGARFITRFVKNRNAPKDPPPLDWCFKPDEGRTFITYREADAMRLFRQWITDGLEACSEIAEEMGLSKGQVSKMAKRAEKDGWLKINRRRYEIIG